MPRSQGVKRRASRVHKSEFIPCAPVRLESARVDLPQSYDLALDPCVPRHMTTAGAPSHALRLSLIRPAPRPSLIRPAQWRWRGRAHEGRGLGRRAPELVASMRPPCPWREAEVAEFRLEVSGRREGEDVGFVSPGHCPGCEQEEVAAHPGRPHPGEWLGRATGPVILVHLRPREGGHGGRAQHGRAAAPLTRSAAAASSPPPTRLCCGDKQARAGLLLGSRAPGNYVSQQAARRRVRRGEGRREHGPLGVRRGFSGAWGCGGSCCGSSA